jgi:hypothetical protein
MTTLRARVPRVRARDASRSIVASARCPPSPRTAHPRPRAHVGRVRVDVTVTEDDRIAAETFDIAGAHRRARVVACRARRARACARRASGGVRWAARVVRVWLRLKHRARTSAPSRRPVGLFTRRVVNDGEN